MSCGTRLWIILSYLVLLDLTFDCGQFRTPWTGSPAEILPPRPNHSPHKCLQVVLILQLIRNPTLQKAACRRSHSPWNKDVQEHWHNVHSPWRRTVVFSKSRRMSRALCFKTLRENQGTYSSCLDSSSLAWALVTSVVPPRLLPCFGRSHSLSQPKNNTLKNIFCGAGIRWPGEKSAGGF